MKQVSIIVILVVGAALQTQGQLNLPDLPGEYSSGGIEVSGGIYNPGNPDPVYISGVFPVIAEAFTIIGYGVAVDANGNSGHIIANGLVRIFSPESFDVNEPIIDFWPTIKGDFSDGESFVSQSFVNVGPERQIYGARTTYTILTATNGVVGTFNYVGIDNLFLKPHLEYPDSNNIVLVLDRIPFSSVARTHNQRAVTGALDKILNSSSFSSSAALSNLEHEFFWLPSAAAAHSALDSLSGEIHGTLGIVDLQQQEAFVHSVSARAGRVSTGGDRGYASTKPIQLANAESKLPPMQMDSGKPWEIWAQGYGSWGNLDSDGNAAGGNFNISGFAGGLDYRLSQDLLFGCALGYSHNDVNISDGRNSSADVDAIQFAGYGSYVAGSWHLDAILSYGVLNTDTKRQINVGAISQAAIANYGGGIFSISAEGGYEFKICWLTVQPTLGFDYAHLSQDRFQEKGAAIDGNNYGLNVTVTEINSFRSSVGVHLATHLGKRIQFIPEIYAAWEHEFGDRSADVSARFIDDISVGADFTTRGLELGEDSGVVSGGFAVVFNKSLSAFANYNARLNKQLTSQMVSGGLSVTW